MPVSLRDKFYGCICGAHIGSAMGAAVEGWSYSQIEERYHTLSELLPYEHYGNGWLRQGGTTEDGIERQKLMITAIMRKRGRVNAEDIRAVWCTEMRDSAPGNVSEPFEGQLLAIAKSGIPASDIGKYCDYAGLNSFARACHPIGLINAGDPQSAAADVFETGQLYQSTNSRGLKWACVTAVSIAAATMPGATADSVVEAIRKYCDKQVVSEIDSGLKLTQSCRDFRALREAFDGVYNGIGMPYAMSSANEVLTKAVCVFKMTNGDAKQAMVSAVNLGRDTDCITAIAAGITGALSGADSIPQEWIEQVDAATQANPFTNTKRTLRENADGLYEAHQARLLAIKEYFDLMHGC